MKSVVLNEAEAEYVLDVFKILRDKWGWKGNVYGQRLMKKIEDALAKESSTEERVLENFQHHGVGE